MRRLSVKTHLADYYKAQNMEVELKSLNALPSADIRPVLSLSTTEQSSNSLRDITISAGLAKAEDRAKWEKIPWQSKAYKRYKEVMGTAKHVPHVPQGNCGSTISMYAPSKHRLFVKYCRSCVGVMTLIADWNADVEEAFESRVEARTNDELRKVIRNLNDFICDQADKYERLRAEHESMKKATRWMETWKECSSLNTDIEHKARRFR